jgi:hypothetical protein
MASIAKQLLINNFNLPKEIIDIVKDYIFHKIKKIPKNDERYKILLTIPVKEYDPTDSSIYVYLNISQEKDYFLVYINYKIQLQTLVYTDDNVVHFIEGTIFSIE